MMPRILIAAPARMARKLSEMLRGRFELATCTEPERAAAFSSLGTYLAIVKAIGFARLTTDIPVIPVSETVGSELLDELVAIRDRARLDQRARAAALAHLAALPYDEYVALARARTTRDYVLALLRQHGGVVSEAARGAGLMRETLHRLIRRHDVDPNWFRDERT